MKKRISILLVLAMVLSLVQIVSPTSTQLQAKSKKMKINKNKATLYYDGSNHTFATDNKIEVLSIKNPTKKVKWTTSNKKVVAIKSIRGKNKKTCTIKAKKKGEATITAKVGKKKFKCKVTVKRYYDVDETDDETEDIKNDETDNQNDKTIASYGDLSGNVTYLYNNYKGNVADTNSVVILVSTSGLSNNVPALDNFARWGTSDINNYNKYGVYMVKVDGTGEYTINHVNTGEYKIIIVSRKTTEGAAFENLEAYKNTIASAFTSYLSNINANYLGEFVGYNKYHVETIKIYQDEETTCSHDFGITYV